MSHSARFLGIAGSLRQNSYNFQLLEALQKSTTQEQIDLEIYQGLSTIPLFNEDMRPVEKRPAAVLNLCEKIENVDGVVIATPEYAQSVPGVLKNLLDWISISPALNEKPVAILGGTTGVWGTRYAQASLRHTLVAMGAFTMQRPMVFVNDIKSQLPTPDQPISPDLEQRLDAFAHGMKKWVRLHAKD
ncbi:NADPH-dependent FMN reductase [uncultured Maritalea sp.]|uniref:NADPH-dependent FMN reductase n=1 Tax=uncultured Maritalea sp. TaxID=757249 RepID=UPI002619472B|nr:NADPH-dependent FMN reductase [uncultured Maritalea sp.]